MTLKGFTPRRVLTSLVRWLLQISNPWGSQYVLLSMPFAKKQLIWDKPRNSLFTLFSRSYFDWATILEVFSRLEYLPKGSHFSREAERRYLELVESGKHPLILDLGANIGAASILFSRVYPSARILAVEPEPANVAQLETNTLSMQSVTVVPYAIARESKTLPLYSDKESGDNAFRTFEDLNGFSRGEVQAKGVQDLLNEHKDLTPFLLKVDIEGFESELFSGDSHWVSSFDLIMIEIHDWMIPGKALSQNALRVLSQIPRDVVISGENLLAVSLRD